MKKSLIAFFLVVLAAASSAYAQAGRPPGKNLIDEDVIREIRRFVDTEIVRLSLKNQNTKYGNISEGKIQELDQQWRAETKIDDQPLISSTLSNPLSSYLIRIQARASGLYTEMFVMDRHGLNVGQSNISSDYWQGDEDKFQKTYPLGGAALFIDEPEYDRDLGIWRIQVNLSIADPASQEAIGAITVELNLTELERRKALGLL